MSAALRDVRMERLRQIEVEGFDAKHDADHDTGDLACAAAAYALHAGCQLNPADGIGFEGTPDFWPRDWTSAWWKPKDPRRNLVRAAALIIAEIERIDGEADALEQEAHGAAGEAGMAARLEQALADVARLEAECKRATDSWHMYADAWQRELKGPWVNKRHHIDALVVTTRRLHEDRDRALADLQKFKTNMSASDWLIKLADLRKLSELQARAQATGDAS